MRIGIDARFYSGEQSKGLGRYTEKLIEHLRNIDRENEYFIFLSRDYFHSLEFPEKNFHKVLADFRWYSFSEQWNMPRLLVQYQLDLMHFPHYNVPLFYGGDFVVTIHDLILHHFPTRRASTLNSLFYFVKQAAYRLVIRHAVTTAKKILTVSEFTKQDIAQTFHVPTEKIIVTYEAADTDKIQRYSEIEKENILKRYGVYAPFLLYVGNAYPHKNLEILLDVVETLKNQKRLKWQLVLVGKMEYFYERLRRLAQSKGLTNEEVCFTGFVPDEELGALYASSFAYIFPSLYEGFGLPPLESMAFGVPVLSTNRSSLPEILGDAAVYFDPTDKNGIIKTIFRLFEDDSAREKFRAIGFSLLKQFSWEKMARQTHQVYLDLKKNA